jgi:hypothetical protein
LVGVFVGTVVAVVVNVGMGLSVGVGGFVVAVGGCKVLVGMLSGDEHDEARTNALTTHIKT